MKIPELLAPAGSPDALKAAVYAGADAVYLGGRIYGARAYASNFDNKEIEQAVQFAHSRGVKVYVTVNTLIRDDDMDSAARYLRFLSDAGVDAVLMQDAGLVSLAREIVPGLPVHASTQMTICNTAGIEFAADHGITRIVLARETPLADVASLVTTAAEHGVQLEIFAHGALCYCYSGQCLFSSAVGGRSGNQGMCAQPCRKPYTLMADGEKVPTTGDYILSPRDLCTYPYLKEISETGVAALKIEGRMKTPEYVAVVTSIYRKALDAVAAGTFEPDNQDMEHLAFAFNRGFTKGYLLGDKWTSLMNWEKPNNRGVYAGIVSGTDQKRGKVIIKTDGPIPDTGDGLVFKFAGREIGFALNKEPYLFPEGDGYKIPAPDGVLEGSELWITKRLKTEHYASAVLSKPAAGRIPIDLIVAVNPEG
ncbi:MAG: peptidase U32 family protein, partial [Methanocorpusculum sp.]|nr:peptidase U32 family protein [Methanocorpusculum sp.]